MLLLGAGVWQNPDHSWVARPTRHCDTRDLASRSSPSGRFGIRQPRNRDAASIDVGLISARNHQLKGPLILNASDGGFSGKRGANASLELEMGIGLWCPDLFGNCHVPHAQRHHASVINVLAKIRRHCRRTLGILESRKIDCHGESSWKTASTSHHGH